MPSPTFNLENRINALNAVLAKKAEQQVVSDALTASNGDWATALTNLTGKLPDASLQKVAFAHTLAAWSGDNVTVVKALTRQPDLTNLRDVALRYNVEQLTALVDPKDVPASIVGATDDEKKRNLAVSLQRELF